MELGRIKELRLTHQGGMNRETLAKEMGISLSALATYERGEREPGAELIIKLAKYFGVTSDYILGLSNTPKAAEEWPPAVPPNDIAIESIDAIKESVEMMLSSADLNSFGLKTLNAYATIINLLPDIDSFAVKQLAELQKEYPIYRQFGTETELEFDSIPLLLALVEGSEDASRFARLHTASVNRISDRCVEASNIIRDILITWVFDAIKGQPLEKQFNFKEQVNRIKLPPGEYSRATDEKNIIPGGNPNA
jgi:transcriptional regulator with XRE-family HTH domain